MTCSTATSSRCSARSVAAPAETSSGCSRSTAPSSAAAAELTSPLDGEAGPRGPAARPAARPGQRPAPRAALADGRWRSGWRRPLGLIGDPVAAGAVLAAIGAPERWAARGDGRRGPAVDGRRHLGRCCATGWPPPTPAHAMVAAHLAGRAQLHPGAARSCGAARPRPDLTGPRDERRGGIGRLGGAARTSTSSCATRAVRAARRCAGPVSVALGELGETRARAGADRAARRRRTPPGRARRRRAAAGRPCRHRGAAALRRVDEADRTGPCARRGCRPASRRRALMSRAGPSGLRYLVVWRWPSRRSRSSSTSSSSTPPTSCSSCWPTSSSGHQQRRRPTAVAWQGRRPLRPGCRCSSRPTTRRPASSSRSGLPHPALPPARGGGRRRRQQRRTFARLRAGLRPRPGRARAAARDADRGPRSLGVWSRATAAPGWSRAQGELRPLRGHQRGHQRRQRAARGDGRRRLDPRARRAAAT